MSSSFGHPKMAESLSTTYQDFPVSFRDHTGNEVYDSTDAVIETRHELGLVEADDGKLVSSVCKRIRNVHQHL